MQPTGLGNPSPVFWVSARIDGVRPVGRDGAHLQLKLSQGGQTLQGMLNIGRRPTLNNGDRLSIEVNLFDFDGDVYGEEITLEFISFLRLEFKMCGIDELKHQLTMDRDNAKRLLKEYLTT